MSFGFAVLDSSDRICDLTHFHVFLRERLESFVYINRPRNNDNLQTRWHQNALLCVLQHYVAFADRLCGLAVRVPGYRTEMYCVSCKVRIYICYVEESRQPLWSSGQSSWLQYGDVLCFLWCTNWIYICYVEGSRPPLWSSGQSFWLQNQRSGFFIPGATRFSEK
jgi:hypothetical protein